MLKNLIWDKSLCKSCNFCINLCPSKNLKFDNSELTEIGKCTKCGICENYCPENAIIVIKGPERGQSKIKI